MICHVPSCRRPAAAGGLYGTNTYYREYYNNFKPCGTKSGARGRTVPRNEITAAAVLPVDALLGCTGGCRGRLVGAAPSLPVYRSIAASGWPASRAFIQARQSSRER